jgi:hypothetical protein
VASTDERPLELGRRKRFPTVEETILDLSDEEDEVVESRSAFSPVSRSGHLTGGRFTARGRKRKWLQPRPFKLTQLNSGGPLRLALSLAESFFKVKRLFPPPPLQPRNYRYVALARSKTLTTTVSRLLPFHVYMT